MVGEASGRMQKADCRDEIALPAAMLAWLKCGKQRTRNFRKRFLVFFWGLHFFLGDGFFARGIDRNLIRVKK